MKATQQQSKKKGKNRKKKTNRSKLEKTSETHTGDALVIQSRQTCHWNNFSGDDEYIYEFTNGFSNFIPNAGKGCHIVRYPSFSTSSNAAADTVQILEWDTDIDPQEDFVEGQVIPDIAIDPEENTLTLCNASSSIRVAYITIYEATCTGRDDKIFLPGITTNHEGVSRSCVTFIVLCPPMTFCTLCYIHPTNGGDLLDIPIESDVQEWTRHPDPSLKCRLPIRGFPLLGGPFLCTQGMGGHLTHYFSGNLHAVDFRCDIGTPLLAVDDGVVVEVRQQMGEDVVSGIGATNLYKWNSILIRHERRNDTSTNCEEGKQGERLNDEVIYTEYVHIQSSKVQEGDVVMRGDVIGYSGSVGFSPEPHLHFAVYKSDEADAVTVGFQFMGQEDGIPYEPRAGIYYSALGPVGIGR